MSDPVGCFRAWPPQWIGELRSSINAGVVSAGELTFGRVRVLVGTNNGRYPHGNSVLVQGRRASVLLDPALVVRERAAELVGRVDMVLLSHVHEDHLAGASLFADRPIHAHHCDALGVRSLEGLIEIYGHGPHEEMTKKLVTEQFHYRARPDVVEFGEGDTFDLGGAVIRAFHAPGHTRGHTCFLIEPEGVLFLADLDLTNFGPYYGDAWSDLEDFVRTLEMVKKIPAKTWVTFHHAGVIEDRERFEQLLDRYRAKIDEREAAILAFLAAGARTVEEMVEHRFLFPRHVNLWYVEQAERRTIVQHLARLEREERVAEVEPGKLLAVGRARGTEGKRRG